MQVGWKVNGKGLETLGLRGLRVLRRLKGGKEALDL